MRYAILSCLLLALAMVAGGPAIPESPPASDDRPPLIATFSIAGIDPETGTCGAAVASKYPAVGKVVAHARAGVGAFCTQHWGNPKWGEPALDLLGKDKLPQEVLATLLRQDKTPDLRQLAIIDMDGHAAQHHPTKAGQASRYWGGISGRHFVCQGNTLTGPEVLIAMARAFEDTKGSLADRLLAALVAGDCAGGDHRGRLAAGMRLCKRGVEGYWLELHVDKSDDAVVDLLKKYVELQHEAKGAWPGGQPPFRHPCPQRPQPRPPAKS